MSGCFVFEMSTDVMLKMEYIIKGKSEPGTIYEYGWQTSEPDTIRQKKMEECKCTVFYISLIIILLRALNLVDAAIQLSTQMRALKMLRYLFTFFITGLKQLWYL